MVDSFLRKYGNYLLIFLFILANSILIANEFYWLSLLPLMFVVILAAFFSLDKLILFLIFTTPLSIRLEELDLGGVGMFLPTEPILFGLMLIFFLKILYEKTFDQQVLKHPVTIFILINLAWLTISTLTSTMPVISLKFLLSRLWFLITFYFLATQLFKHYPNIKRSIWLYIIPFTGVILYTLISHATYGFQEDPAHWVMNPFYKDHTSYGAALAFYFPPLLGMIFIKKHTPWIKWASLFLLLLFSVALVFSYTRAAWVSILAAAIVFLCMILKIRFSYLLGIAIIGLTLFFTYQDKILLQLEQNKQDSSDNLTEHVESISNVASDASNLERINRWNCAWRMFYDKPVFGFGPGTYQFKYAPYQKASEMTIISTNFGDKGNAHSEYLGPLAESGLMGSLSFIGILLSVSYTAFRLFRKMKKSEERLLMTSTYLGLITYYAHAFLNNFLTTDKISAPFWMFTAIIVVMDLYHKKEQSKDPETE